MNSNRSAGFVKTAAGLQFRIVAVADTTTRVGRRLADHAWLPDGMPYEGPEARLAQRGSANAPEGGMRRFVVFEIETPPSAEKPGHKTDASSAPLASPETSIDVFAYLPNGDRPKSDTALNTSAAGPTEVKLWNGVPTDSSGGVVLRAPASVGMEFGLGSTDPQDVCVGVAKGDYKVIARGPVSIPAIIVNPSVVIAAGPWGRIEVAPLPRPRFESRPSPTHRLQLLGGVFPPKSERIVIFFDSKGNRVAHCGDGPNNGGAMGPRFFAGHDISDVTRFELQERPYDFVNFDGIKFDAPPVKSYSGETGRAHAIDTSLGKVLGILKPTKDGPWSGFVLYAADGTRWLDPDQNLSGYLYGMFDPWNHPLDDRRCILLEIAKDFPATTTPITCEVYAADSPDGPNRERLTSWDELPFQTPMTTIPSSRTDRPYLRLEVKVGDGAWKTFETIPVGESVHRMAESGTPGSRVLEVFFDGDGGIRIWKDEASPVHSKSKWRPEDQRIRALAHLQDGETAELSFNMSGYSGTDPKLSRYRGFEYTRQANGTVVHSGFKTFNFREIASIDLQTQSLKPPETITLHSPVD